jgi:hypothetical protein
MRRGVGDGPRAVRRDDEAWGAWGAHGWHTIDTETRGGRCLTGGPSLQSGRRRFEYISNSNEFKLLQNLSNFV